MAVHTVPDGEGYTITRWKFVKERPRCDTREDLHCAMC